MSLAEVSSDATHTPFEFPPWNPRIERERGENRDLVDLILACPDDFHADLLIQRFRERTMKAALRLDAEAVWNFCEEEGIDLPIWSEENVLRAFDSHAVPEQLSMIWDWRYLPRTTRSNPRVLQKLIAQTIPADDFHFNDLGVPLKVLQDQRVAEALIQSPSTLYDLRLPNNILSSTHLFVKACDSICYLHMDLQGFIRFAKQFNKKVLSHRNTMIHASKRLSSHVLEICHPSLKDDEVFALAVARNLHDMDTNRTPLKFFSKRLRANQQVVQAFCRHYGENLKVADHALRRDETILRAACLSSASSLRLCLDPALRNRLLDDKELAVSVLDSYQFDEYSDTPLQYFWRHLNKRLKRDRDVSIRRVRKGLGVTDKLPKHLADDRLFWNDVFDVDQVHEFSFKPAFWTQLAHVADEHLVCQMLKQVDDQDLFWEAALRYPAVFRNKDVFLCVVDHGLEHHAEQVLLDYGTQHDTETVAEFITEMGPSSLFVLQRANSPLLTDVAVLELLANSYLDELIQVVDPLFQHAHPNLVIEMLRENGEIEMAVDFVAGDLFDDRDFVIRAIEATDGYILTIIDPLRFIEDEEMVLLYAKYVPMYFMMAGPTLLSNPEFWLKAIARNPALIAFLPQFLCSMDHLLCAAAQAPEVLGLLPRDLNDPDDFEAIIGLAVFVRVRIEPNVAFLQFLGGLKDSASPIAMLDQGHETSQSFVHRIASYLELPRGDELAKLRKMSALLAEWGL